MTCKREQKQAGFTIIELMIATTVLSVILVMVSAMMISIGRLYYKGINQSRVQGAVRSISDDVSQHLQLGNGYTSGSANGWQAYCIAGMRYSFTLKTELGSGKDTDSSDKSPHLLWRDTAPAEGGCSPATDFANGTELMPTNTRLLAFNLTGASSPYTIQLAIGYGDLDLFNVAHKDDLSYTTNCRGSEGNQFCATARLQTAVVQRLTGE